MQQRFHISYHADFDAALAAKKELKARQPNEVLQIRKRKTNFELVGRTNNLEVVSAKKKKPPKKPWNKSLEAPPFTYEYNNQRARDNGTGKWAERGHNHKDHNTDQL